MPCLNDLNECPDMENEYFFIEYLLIFAPTGCRSCHPWLLLTFFHALPVTSRLILLGNFSVPQVKSLKTNLPFLPAFFLPILYLSFDQGNNFEASGSWESMIFLSFLCFTHFQPLRTIYWINVFTVHPELNIKQPLKKLSLQLQETYHKHKLFQSLALQNTCQSGGL